MELTSRDLALLKERGICPVCKKHTIIEAVSSIMTNEVGIRTVTCNHLVLPFSSNPFKYLECPNHFKHI